MKNEYDFTTAQRGQFYRSDIQLNLPVYLDADILDYLTIKAQAKGIAVTQIVNQLLRKDIDLIEKMK